MEYLATHHSWFIDALLKACLVAFGCVLFVVVVWVMMKLLHRDFHEFFAAMMSEPIDSRAGKHTVGAINWRGFVRFVTFGVVVIIVTELGKLLTLLLVFLEKPKAEAFVKSVDFFTLFYFAGFVFILSVCAVLADNWRRSK